MLFRRRANLDDSDAVAALHRRVRRTCLPFLPDLHTPEEDRGFFRERVLTTCTVWAAESRGGDILGFVAFRDGWVDHLYVDRAWHGCGLGSALLAKAMEAHDRLQLWTFQRNRQARRFYESRGFRAAALTDGSGNEEREPDIRYEWRRG